MRRSSTSARALFGAWLLLGGMAAGWPGTSSAEDAPTTTLLIHVDGLRRAQGQLLIHIYDGEKGFLVDASKAVRQEVHPVDGTALTLQIDGQARGRYAIAVIHDEDGDGELGTNFLGIPREGVGLSNNPKSRFGPPRFSAAAVDIDGDRVVMDITIRYL